MRERFSASVVADVVAVHWRGCWLCGRPVDGESVSLDHVRPVVYGGTDDVENLRPAHTRCNLLRGEWDVSSYYAWALARGDDGLVPEGLREGLRAGAEARAAAAAAHYARGTRWTPLVPLGGSWSAEDQP